MEYYTIDIAFGTLVRYLRRDIYMDIAALSTAMAQADVMNSVSIAVLDKTMEMSEDLGAGLINMIDHSMELSVNPHIGSNIDVLV